MSKRRSRDLPPEVLLRGHPERPPETVNELPRYQSSSLFGNCPCIVIEHGSEEYRLRVTRLGKLILTK